jgi:hypothetical protein
MQASSSSGGRSGCPTECQQEQARTWVGDHVLQMVGSLGFSQRTAQYTQNNVHSHFQVLQIQSHHRRAVKCAQRL